MRVVTTACSRRVQLHAGSSPAAFSENSPLRISPSCTGCRRSTPPATCTAARWTRLLAPRSP
eukprot:4764000-Prymnesium_polylepis.1